VLTRAATKRIVSQNLRASLRSDGGRLDVVATEELLEVEDGKVVSLTEGEELAESSVGLDGLLVHKVVGLGIGHDTLGDGRAANLSSLGLTKEGAELISNLDGLGEDARLGLSTLDLGTGPLAAAISALGEAGSLLLDGLEGGGSSGGSSLEVVEVLLKGSNGLLERGTEVLISDSGRSGDNIDDRGSNRGGNSLSLGGLLGGLGNNRGSRSHRGRNNSGNSLSLGGLLGGLGGRAHRVSGGGSRCGHGTQ
jgi:hypothetical protein